MRVNKITNNQPSFRRILSFTRYGFSAYQTKSTQAVEEAFKNSKILQDFCTKNDVKITLKTDSVPDCLNNGMSYAALTIRKILPKESIGDKLSGLLNKKTSNPNTFHLYTQGYGCPNMEYELAEKISSINTPDAFMKYGSSSANVLKQITKKCKNCLHHDEF